MIDLIHRLSKDDIENWQTWARDAWHMRSTRTPPQEILFAGRHFLYDKPHDNIWLIDPNNPGDIPLGVLNLTERSNCIPYYGAPTYTVSGIYTFQPGLGIGLSLYRCATHKLGFVLMAGSQQSLHSRKSWHDMAHISDTEVSATIVVREHKLTTTQHNKLFMAAHKIESAESIFVEQYRSSKSRWDKFNCNLGIYTNTIGDNSKPYKDMWFATTAVEKNPTVKNSELRVSGVNLPIYARSSKSDHYHYPHLVMRAV